MNTHKKGLRIERLAMKALEADGWITDKKNWSRWESKDFFSQFDIVCIKGDEIKWIQVKSNRSGFYAARISIKRWLRKHNLKLNCEVWLKENRKPWRIEKQLSTH